MARAVAPGCPHHINQRGNRRKTTFFYEEKDRAYLGLMAQLCNRYQVVTFLDGEKIECHLMTSVQHEREGLHVGQVNKQAQHERLRSKNREIFPCL